MDGSASGTAAAHDEATGKFLVGNSEYRARQKRLADRLAQLLIDFDPSPSQRMLMPIICRHLDDAERGRTAVSRTRASNTARRLLKDIPRKSEPALPHRELYPLEVKP